MPVQTVSLGCASVSSLCIAYRIPLCRCLSHISQCLAQRHGAGCDRSDIQRRVAEELNFLVWAPLVGRQRLLSQLVVVARVRVNRSNAPAAFAAGAVVEI
jgi:hypothetical protein